MVETRDLFFLLNSLIQNNCFASVKVPSITKTLKQNQNPSKNKTKTAILATGTLSTTTSLILQDMREHCCASEAEWPTVEQTTSTAPSPPFHPLPPSFAHRQLKCLFCLVALLYSALVQKKKKEKNLPAQVWSSGWEDVGLWWMPDKRLYYVSSTK